MTHDIDVNDLTDDALSSHLRSLSEIRDQQEDQLRETTRARNLAIVEQTRRQIRHNHPEIAHLEFTFSDGDPSEGIAPRLIFEAACTHGGAVLNLDEDAMDLGADITMSDLESAVNDLEPGDDYTLHITSA